MGCVTENAFVGLSGELIHLLAGSVPSSVVEEVEEHMVTYGHLAGLEGTGFLSVALDDDFGWGWYTGFADRNYRAFIYHELLPGQLSGS